MTFVDYFSKLNLKQQMYSFLCINKLVAHCDARNTFTKHKMLAYTKEFMAFVFVTFRKYVAFSNFSSAELYTSI